MLYVFHNYMPVKGQISGSAAFPIAFLGLSAPVTGSTCTASYPSPAPQAQPVRMSTRNNSVSPPLQKLNAKIHCCWLPPLIWDTDVPSSECSTTPVTVTGPCSGTASPTYTSDTRRLLSLLTLHMFMIWSVMNLQPL